MSPFQKGPNDNNSRTAPSETQFFYIIDANLLSAIDVKRGLSAPPQTLTEGKWTATQAPESAAERHAPPVSSSPIWDVEGSTGLETSSSVSITRSNQA